MALERNALKLFGTQDLIAGAAQLKRQLLLYDQIHYDPKQVQVLADSLRGVTIYPRWPDTSHRVRPDEVSRLIDETLASINYLKAQGILQELKMAEELPYTLNQPLQYIQLLQGAYAIRSRGRPLDKDMDDWLTRAQAALTSVETASTFIHAPVDMVVRSDQEDPAQTFVLRTFLHATLTRGIAARRDLTPLFDDMDEMHFAWAGHILGKGEASPTAQLGSVVLSAFPCPSDDVPLDDILQFREQARSKELFARMRDWLGEIPNTDQPEKLAERLHNGLIQYQAHMRRQKISLFFRPLQLLFGVIGRFFTGELRLNDGLQVVGSLIDGDAAFHSAEAKAPRKEVAYIAQVQSRFGGDQ